MGSEGLGPLVRLLVSLPLVLLLAYGGLRLFQKQLASGSRTGRMQVIDQLALGPRSRLSVVKLGDRVLLLGVTEANITLLAELDDYPEAARDWKDAGKNGMAGKERP